MRIVRRRRTRLTLHRGLPHLRPRREPERAQRRRLRVYSRVNEFHAHRASRRASRLHRERGAEADEPKSPDRSQFIRAKRLRDVVHRGGEGHDERRRALTPHIVVMSANETTPRENDRNAPGLDVDEIMRQLCDEFKARNGREATADEMKQWQEQLLEAMKDGALEL